MSAAGQTLPVRAGRAAGGPGPRLSLAPIEKAAIILTAMGPDFAAGVLRELSEANLKRLAGAVAALGRVSQEMLDAVVVEFLEALTTGGDLSGGADAARRLLGGVLEEEQIAELLGGAKPKATVWERLGSAPVAAVADYLAAEHPQTAAVVLGELKAETAAGILERLKPELAREVVLRLARVPTLDRTTSEAVQRAIERDFLSALQRSLNRRRPAEVIAGLMNNISSEARDGFLSHLEAAEPELATDVQRSMFTFEDIAARIAPRDVATVVRDLPEEVLLPALKFGQMQASASVGYILENIPRRLGERLVEELAAMDDVSRKEGEAAHIELAKRVLALQKAGAISFLDREEA